MGKQSPSTTASKLGAEVRTIRAIAVKSVATTFRRIGIAFSREAVHLDPELLTEEQIEALKNEPGLHITGVEIDVAVPDKKPTTPIVTPIAAPAADAAE